MSPSSCGSRRRTLADAAGETAAVLGQVFEFDRANLALTSHEPKDVDQSHALVCRLCSNSLLGLTSPSALTASPAEPTMSSRLVPWLVQASLSQERRFALSRGRPSLPTNDWRPSSTRAGSNAASFAHAACDADELARVDPFALVASVSSRAAGKSACSSPSSTFAQCMSQIRRLTPAPRAMDPATPTAPRPIFPSVSVAPLGQRYGSGQRFLFRSSVRPSIR